MQLWKNVTVLGVGLAVASATWAAVDPLRYPPLEKFNPSIIFYASMNGTADAMLSPGSGKPKTEPGPSQFVPGFMGQAFASGPKVITYDLGKELHVARNGAVAMWCSGKDLKHGQAGAIQLAWLNVSGREIALARMPNKGESLYAYSRFGGRNAVSTAGGSTAAWKDGDWHLLVMNWRADSIEMSTDGDMPYRTNFSPAYEENAKGPAQLTISTAHPSGNGSYLIAAVMIFKAPLSPEEIQWFFQNGNAAK